jgi:hypothetical protein
VLFAEWVEVFVGWVGQMIGVDRWMFVVARQVAIWADFEYSAG